MTKQKPSTTKQPERKPIKIHGAFVHRTFIVSAIQAEYSELEARTLFETMLKRGEIVAAGKIGILKEVCKFEMKKN